MAVKLDKVPSGLMFWSDVWAEMPGLRSDALLGCARDVRDGENISDRLACAVVHATCSMRGTVVGSSAVARAEDAIRATVWAMRLHGRWVPWVAMGVVRWHPVFDWSAGPLPVACWADGPGIAVGPPVLRDWLAAHAAPRTLYVSDGSTVDVPVNMEHATDVAAHLRSRGIPAAAVAAAESTKRKTQDA